VFEHQTKENGTTADFEWRGPTLNAIWPEVLAFFRWTNDTMRSESQVRLYVNVREQRWEAWAYPQKANLGMHAKELTETDEGYERTKEQRAQFPDPDWYYWGTVHHHCNSPAFQSGPDQDNERSQDGIHITVGNLGSPMYDLHVRLYVSKFKLAFSLCDFWDIGNELTALPRHIQRMLKDDAPNEMAKLLMCVPPPADQTFPDIWRENIIDCTPKQMAVVSHPVNNGGPHQSHMAYSRKPLTERGKMNFEMDLRRAANAMLSLMESPESSITGLPDLMNNLRHLEAMLDDEMIDLMDIMSLFDVLPANLVNWMEKMVKDQKEKDAPKELTGGERPTPEDYHGWEGMGG